MSSLAQIIGQLESGSGAAVSRQPAGMVNPYYGQYPGFVSQYGNGEAGINNYAAQTLAANPNATVGDLYAGYVLNTGQPGAYSFSQLQSTTVPGAQGAASNFIQNAGVSPNTPLSSFVGGSNTTADTSNGFFGSVSYDTPTQAGADNIGNIGSAGTQGSSASSDFFNQPFGAVDNPPTSSYTIGGTSGQFGSLTPDVNQTGSPFSSAPSTDAGTASGGTQSTGGAIAGIATNSGGGLPVDITDVTSAASQAGQSVQSGLNTAAQAVTSSEQSAATTGTGWLQQIFTTGENFFQRSAVAIFGIIFIAAGAFWFTRQKA